jgi:hypothetical protein
MHITGRNAMLAVLSGFPLITADAASPFSGRWDLTIITSSGSYPWWLEITDALLEITDKRGAPAIRIAGRTGCVYPLRNASIDGARLT